MVQYINKATIVAEIKERMDRGNEMAASYSGGSEHDYLCRVKESVYKDLLSFLDTLEVKEVDLDREIEREIETRWRGEYLFTTKFKESAKHFFELGLNTEIKTQKGIDYENRSRIDC